jgi:hypothetical protein
MMPSLRRLIAKTSCSSSQICLNAANYMGLTGLSLGMVASFDNSMSTKWNDEALSSVGKVDAKAVIFFRHFPESARCIHTSIG